MPTRYQEDVTRTGGPGPEKRGTGLGLRSSAVFALLAIAILLLSTLSVPVSTVMARDDFVDFEIVKNLWGENGGEYIVWSPDGRYVVSQTSSEQEDRFSFRYWDVEDGWEIGNVDTGHSGNIYSFAWSPDSSRLATVFRELIIFEVEGWQASEGISPDGSIIRSVDWAPEGNRLAIGTEIGAVHIVDTGGLEPVEEINVSKHWIERVRWSPDGTMLAVSDVLGKIRIYATSDWSVKWVFDRHKESTKGLTWSPDSTELVSSSFDSNILLWDTVKGRFKTKIGGHGPHLAVFDVHWNGASSLLLSAGARGILVWDTETWDLLQKRIYGRDDEPLAATTVSWGPEGKRFVSTDLNTVDLWAQRTDGDGEEEEMTVLMILGGILAVVAVALVSFEVLRKRRKRGERMEKEEGEEEE